MIRSMFARDGAQCPAFPSGFGQGSSTQGYSRRVIVRSVTLALASAWMLLATRSLPAQFEDLLKRIPAGANAIMVVNVPGLHNSPIGKAERWKEQMAESYMNRPIIMPPEAEWVVLASLFDPDTDESVWDIAVMSLDSNPSLRAIARAEGGYVDTINGTEAAWTPSKAYFVNLGSKMLGMMYPAHRQAVSRWVDYAKNATESRLSSYLQGAAAIAQDKNFQVVLAIDLKDMVRPHILKEKLEKSSTLKGKKFDADALRNAILSIQGATMTISMRDKAYGRLQVDFEGNIRPLDPFARELILEALDGAGAHLEDLKDWKLETSATSLSLNGVLSKDSLRRIGSLLELPSTKFVTEKPGETAKSGATAEASKVYFKSVQTLSDDLRRTLKENRDNHAVWMERYARKIDRLPILNVDDELLAFGADVAERMRQAAVAERSSLIRGGVRKSETYGNYYYGSYNSDYGYYRGTEDQQATITLQENQKSREVRISQWKTIDDEMAQIRQKMTKKYMVEF